ncbi:MAG: TldD/PmbA family protein [Lachnospiraceae bacterium]|nr:TldD/PmbA family protein [Lachnospiraceae bacterium]
MERLVNVTSATVEKLKNKGADFGYVCAYDHEKKEFNVEGNKFSLFRTTFNNSMDICVYKDKKKGSVNINNLSEESIDEALENSFSFAKEGNEDEAYAIFPKQENKNFVKGLKESDSEEFFKRCEELLADIEKKYPKILICLMICSFDKTRCAYENTNGTKYTEEEGYYNIVLEFSAKEGDEVTSLNYFGFPCVSLDKPFIENPVVYTKLDECCKLLGAKPLDGKMEDPTVIFTPDCLSDMLGYFYNSFIGEESIIDKTCLWYDKLNEKLVDERFTLSIKPLDERILGGQNFTTQGRDTWDYDVIKNGVLKAFPISLYAANKSGFEPAPCMSYIPVVEAGDVSIDEIIKNTKNGIIVGGYSGGHPAANGEFSGIAKSSFLVKDGKVEGPVSEAMISGNFVTMLNNIVGLSKELFCDGNKVMPYLACKEIVVAGK